MAQEPVSNDHDLNEETEALEYTVAYLLMPRGQGLAVKVVSPSGFRSFARGRYSTPAGYELLRTIRSKSRLISILARPRTLFQQ